MKYGSYTLSTLPYSASVPTLEEPEIGRKVFGSGYQGASAAPKVRRIMHLAKHCVDGNGHVHVAVDLACVQAAAGCDVVFVSGGGTYADFLDQNGVRHIHLDHDPGKPLSMIKALWGLVKLAWSFRPEILHAHMMSSALVGYLVCLVTRAQLVTTVHNSFDAHSGIMRLGKRVVAVSNAEKTYLISRGFHADRVDVVMNAPGNSPREGTRQNETNICLQRPCITTICGLHRRKGVFDLLEAFGALVDEMSEWTLYIAGIGPDGEALKQQALEAGLGNRVVFLGAVPAPRVLYEQTDIFVLCSYADPCSLVIGEARSMGCAIVATSVGGTPEMLEFGRAGRLVPAGEPRQLAAELSGLMKDPEARKVLQRASTEGQEVFDVHRLLGDYDLVYQNALSS